jgi:uncharacterized membrane protein
MYQITWEKELPAIALVLLVIAITLALYPQYPDRLAIHWNLRGEVDGYETKTVLNALLLPLVTVAIMGLMLFLPFLDPKREKYVLFDRPYRTIRFAIVAVLCLIHGSMIMTYIGHPVPNDKFTPAVLSLLFILMGNLMGKIRQNWVIGVRLPWTLAREDVWNRTNRLGGKLFIASGLIGLVGLLLPSVWPQALLMGSLLLAVGITIIYSVIISRNPKVN